MKRGRGRPKKQKPWEYWDDLSSLRVFAEAGLRGMQKTKVEKIDGKSVKLPNGKFFEFPNGVQLRYTCEQIIADHGAVMWVDDSTGAVVEKITHGGTLRNEIMKAMRMHGIARPFVRNLGNIKITWTSSGQRRLRLVVGERILHQK